MGEGIVPDSDPVPPLLDPLHPEWILLGAQYNGTESDAESSKDAEPFVARQPRTRKRPQTHSRSRSPPTLGPPFDSSPPRPVAANVQLEEPMMLPPLAQDTHEAHPNRAPNVVHEDDTIMEDANNNSPLLPRRKRFNFETWVRHEKRAHERVYHRRYAVFHGANSDSEDDDYGEMDGESTELDTPRLTHGALEPGDEEVLKTGSPRQIQSDRRIELDANRSSDAIPRRPRLHIIDSESESEDGGASVPDASDTESTSSTLSSALPMFERRLTKPIPASRNVVSADPDSQPDSQQDSLPESDSLPEVRHQLVQQHFVPDGSSLPSLQGYRGEQAVQNHAPIDYMLSHRSEAKKVGARRPRRLGANYTPLAITDLAHEAGPKATRVLRIAARTAQRTSRALGGRLRTDDPLKKVFAGTDSREATRTLRHWRQGTLHVTRKQGVSRPPSSERIQRNSSVPAKAQRSNAHISVTGAATGAAIPASVSGSASSSTKPARKKQKLVARRRAPEPSPNLFHTTILERQLTSRSRSVPSMQPSANDYVRSSSRQAVHQGRRKGASMFDFATSERIKVSENSPSLRLEPRRFGRSTFIGSNTLDLLEGPTIWNGELIADRSFGTPLRDADEAAVTKDAEYVLATCEGTEGQIDVSLFDKMYDYFLQGVAFLCDESQIVEANFRKHVYRQWLRLSRSVLKLSLKRRHSATATPLVSQLVSLATVVVARRLSALAEVNFMKASLLLAWTVYYHQEMISAQIDNQFVHPPRCSIGAELIYAGFRFQCFENLSQVFSKHSQASAKWHLLVLLSSCQSRGWSDWGLARLLVSSDTAREGHASLQAEDVRVATNYLMLLLTKWHWPPSAEIIIDLFNYYAKQQHYADPRGESIWLPDFLLKSRFDGSQRPDQDFSMFLELLGCTLKLFADNLPVCRRIAGRVTPLSAMSFPETKEVSLADLSSASHQYGILIVLLRMSPPASRPSIAQFRDLVVLKNAHLAIRFKAVSTWSIVSRLVADGNSAAECQSWLRDDILRDEVPPPQLLLVSLRSAAEVAPISPGVVPFTYLFEMGLRSVGEEIRAAAWTLLMRMRPAEREALLMRLQTLGHHFSNLGEADIEAFAKLASANVDLVRVWPSAETRVSVVTKLLEHHAVAANHPLAQQYILTSLLRATWQAEDIRLLNSARLPVRSEIGDRQTALRRMLGRPISMEFASLALETVKKEWDAVRADSAARTAYKIVVAQTRQLVFEQRPELTESSAWFDDAEARGIELAQLNISKFVAGQKNSEGEFFFAYKLRRSLETDGGQTLTDELIAALSLTDLEKARKSFEFVVNGLFAFYFRIAIHNFPVMQPALPTLVRIARLAMCQGSKLQYNPTPMLFNCMHFLYAVLPRRAAYDPEDMGILVCELYYLGYIWLQQVASSKAESVYDEAIVGLWVFGRRFSDEWFQWRDVEPRDFETGDVEFDASAVISALRGLSRTKLRAVTGDWGTRLKEAWTAFDRLAACYEHYRRDGVDLNETQWAADAFTLKLVERPPGVIEDGY